MSVERLRRMAGEGDQDARAELSRLMARSMTTEERVDVSLRDGTLVTAVSALDESRGVLGFIGRADRQRWAHMAPVITAYRRRVLSDYIDSGMTRKIWAWPVDRREHTVGLSGHPVYFMRRERVAHSTPRAHQKNIWENRDAHILTTEGIRLALFRGKAHVTAMRHVMRGGDGAEPASRWNRLTALRGIDDGRAWIAVAGARLLAAADPSQLDGDLPERRLTITGVDALVASILITGEVTT